MKNIKERKQRIIFCFIAALLIVGVGYSFYYAKQHKAGYNNPDFKAYLEMHHYCSGFFGGETETDEQIYKQWQEKQLIGC